MMPSHVRKEFWLSGQAFPGLNRLKRFWIYSGMKVGYGLCGNGIAVRNTIASRQEYLPLTLAPTNSGDDSMRTVHTPVLPR
jgi:hypothetical protein